MLVRVLAQLLKIRDTVAVDAHDDVVLPQALQRRGAAGIDGCDERTASVGRIRQARTIKAVRDSRRGEHARRDRGGRGLSGWRRWSRSACCGLPSRTRPMSTLSPTRSRPMTLLSSAFDFTLWPLTVVMTSPVCTPAFSAADPPTTSDTSAPRAVRKPQRVGDVRRQRVDVDAQHATLDRAELQELILTFLHHVDRDRKADADVAAALGQDRGVDADQFALAG